MPKTLVTLNYATVIQPLIVTWLFVISAWYVTKTEVTMSTMTYVTVSLKSGTVTLNYDTVWTHSFNDRGIYHNICHVIKFITFLWDGLTNASFVHTTHLNIEYNCKVCMAVPIGCKALLTLFRFYGVGFMKRIDPLKKIGKNCSWNKHLPFRKVKKRNIFSYLFNFYFIFFSW